MIAIIAAIAGYGVCQSYAVTPIDELTLINIEALANSEIGTGYIRHTYPCPYPSYKTMTTCTRGGSEECYPSDC